MSRKLAAAVMCVALGGQQAQAQVAGVVVNGIRYAMPPDPARAKMCETEEGRAKLWADQPPWTKKDLGFQAEGMKVDYETYRLAFVEQMCDWAINGILPSYDYDTPLAGFNWWECDADWDEDCKDEQRIAAPLGWQICKLSFVKTKDRGDETGLKIEPRDFLTSLPEQVRRFRTLHLRLYASGSGSTSRKGARIRVERLSVTVVPDTWPDSARQKLSCIVPDASKAPPPPPAPQAQPVASHFSSEKFDSGRSYRISFYNPGTVPSPMQYEVYLLKGNKWQLEAYGVEYVPAQSTWKSGGYHDWEAVDWRATFRLVK